MTDAFRPDRTRALRAGVIGCGFFAQNHLNAWSGIADVDLVAVCDRDAEKADAAARRFGATAFTDAAEILETGELDFVDVITTVESHRPLVEMAAKAGAGVICQKPFAETLDDARAMVAACEAAGVPLMVHENFRWQKGLRDLGQIVAGGSIGTPFRAHIEFGHRWPVYDGQPYLRTVDRLAIMDVGLHLFDVARFLLGEVTSVHCRTQRINPDVAGEDVFTASLGHASGAVSVNTCSFFSRRDPDPFPQVLVTVEGDAGTVELLTDYRLRHHAADGTRETQAEASPAPWMEAPWHVVQDSVRAIQQHWVDTLREGGEPRPSGADNLRTLEVAMAAYESAAKDAVVKLG
ncbi:MAG: Gfo/Idh/MocA family oxidoreductase [Pseudomonadota bacterium]